MSFKTGLKYYSQCHKTVFNYLKKTKILWKDRGKTNMYFVLRKERKY